MLNCFSVADEVLPDNQNVVLQLEFCVTTGVLCYTTSRVLCNRWSGSALQMEFCPRTLKKILVAGPIEECDAWQVMTHLYDKFLLIPQS